MTWNLTKAKNRLSDIVNLALTEGPQTITRRNDAVVVVSAERYAELTGQEPDFKECLFQDVGLDELDLTRDPNATREVNL